MNYRAMIDRVKYTLGMQEIVAHDEIAFIKAYLNEGVLDVLVRTRPYTRTINLSLTGGVAIHDMSTDILALLEFLLSRAPEPAQVDGEPDYNLMVHAPAHYVKVLD